MHKGKLFPLRLPEKYHGTTREYQTNTQKYFMKSAQKEPCDQPSKKVSKWQRKISDFDVNLQRKQFLVHPAKISLDNPDWLKSTFHHYHRSEAKPLNRENKQEKKKFDVFGQRKIQYSANKNFESTPDIRKQRQQRLVKQVSSKIGVQQKPIALRKMRMTQQVTGKVGFMQGRTNLVKKPQLKVGSLYENNFINTYSVN